MKKNRKTTIYWPEANFSEIQQGAKERHHQIFGKMSTFSFSKYIQFILLRDLVTHGLFDGDLEDPFDAKPNENLTEEALRILK